MKIIFFGTSNFAVPSLEKIMSSRHKLLAVVTQPDRRKGRKLVLAPPPVKAQLQGKSIAVHQPKDASDHEEVNLLKRYGADLFIVVAFGQILKKAVLDIPKEFCVNLHASLLPKYRGAAPVNWAVINGDKTTGVTTIRMNERMDEGDIVLKEELDIPDTDTSETLDERLSRAGAGLLLDTIDAIERGEANFSRQSEDGASYAPKLKKEDGLINWSMGALDIHNRVRGLIPWPSAYTRYNGKLLKIWKSGVAEGAPKKAQAGEMIEAGGEVIIVGTGSGSLRVEELQLQGGKRLAAGQFLRGHKLTPGDRLG